MIRLRLDRRLHRRVDTADILQETFLTVQKKFPDWFAEQSVPFFLWLRLEAGQKLIDVHRFHLGAKMRDARQEVTLYGSMPSVDSITLAERLLGRLTSASQAAMRAELKLRVQDALNNMEPHDREILVLQHAGRHRGVSDVSSTDDAILEFGEVADAFVDAYRRGLEPDIEAYAEQYPEFADQIRDLLPTLIVMEKAKSPNESESSGVNTFDSSMIGRNLGDYEILREIGRGGMGVVYEARQISLGRHVALKVMPKQEPFKAKQQIRFEREAKAAARLHHTNIVPVFGVGEEDNLCYYVMQYIKGLGLDEVLDQLRLVRNQPNPRAAPRADSDALSVVRSMLSVDEEEDDSAVRPSCSSVRARSDAEADITGELLSEHTNLAESSSSLPGLRTGSSHDSHSAVDPYWRNIAGIGVQVADALQYAHEQGVTHRDIKPSNLLLDVRNTVWVTDFGLAKADDEINITRSGDILGTIRYMPPESFEGNGDARSDLYSLGITLYELATLKPAFSATGRGELMKQVVSERPEPVDKLAPNIPRDLATIIDKAIEREPNDRYQTAATLREDLRRYLNDEPIRARRLSWRERLGRWSRRNRPLAASLVGLITLLILIVVGSVTAAVYFSDQEATQRRMFGEATVLAQKNEKLLNESVESGKRLESARNEARQQSEFRQRNLYSANMLNAYARLQGHRGYARAQQLLELWRPAEGKPDLRGWEWYYLQSLCHQYAFRMDGHSNYILGMSIDSAGERIASVSRDGELIIWDLKQRKALKRIATPIKDLRCVAWDPKNRYVVAGGVHGMAMWEVGSWKQLRVVPQYAVYGLQWSPDGRWLAHSSIKTAENGRRSNEVALLDPQTLKVAMRLPGLSRSLFALQLSFSADGRRVAFPMSKRLRVWEIPTKKLIYQGPSRAAWNYVAAFHPSDANVLIEAGRDNIARRIDLQTNEVTVEFRGHTHGISHCAWHPDGKQIATASWDGSIRLWNATTGELEKSIQGHERHVFALAWSPDGKELYSSGYDRAIKCWRPAELAISTQFKIVSRMTDCQLTPDGSSLIVGSSSGHLNLYNVADGSLKKSFRNGTDLIRAIKLDSSGNQFVTAGSSTQRAQGAVRLWNLQSDRPLLEYWHPKPVRTIDWSSDGNIVALGASDGSIQLLDRKLRPKGKPISTRMRSFRMLEFGPNNEYLAFGGSEGFGLLHLATGKTTYWPGANSDIYVMKWNRSGTRIAVATASQHVVVWDAVAGKKLITFPNHFEPIFAMNWSPDDQRLLAVDARGTLTLWNHETGHLVFELQTGIGKATTAIWSADGRKILSNSDRDILILDASPGYDLEANRAEHQPVASAAEVLESRVLLTTLSDLTDLYVIKHGRIDQVLEEPGQAPDWAFDLASAINDSRGFGVSQSAIDNSVVSYDTGSFGVPANGSAEFLIFNWAEISDIDSPGTADNDEVAGVLADLVRNRLPGDGSRIDVHFIGHSRGSYVTLATIGRLNNSSDNAKIGELKVTTLDPQDYSLPEASEAIDLVLPSNVDEAENFYQYLFPLGGGKVDGATNTNLTARLGLWNGRSLDVGAEHLEVVDHFYWSIDTDDTQSPYTLRDGDLASQQSSIADDRELLYEDPDPLEKITQSIRSAAQVTADGVGEFFTEFASTLESTFADVEVPVLSDQLKNVLEPVVTTLKQTGSDVRDVLEDVLTTVTRAGTTDPLGSLQGALYMLLGPGQAGLQDLHPDIQHVLQPLAAEIDAIHLGLLQDGPDLGGLVNPSDIVISIGEHGDPTIPDPWVQFDFHLGQIEVLNLSGFDLAFDTFGADVPSLSTFFNGFGFQVNSETGITSTLRWDLRLGFGIREELDAPTAQKFFINSGATVSGLPTGEGVEEFKASITTYATPANKAETFGDAANATTTSSLSADISLGLLQANITDGTPTDVKITAPTPLGIGVPGGDTLTILVNGGEETIVLNNVPDLSNLSDVAPFMLKLNEQLLNHYSPEIPDVAFTIDFGTVTRNADPEVNTTPTIALSAHAPHINNLTIVGGEKYGFLAEQHEDARGKNLGFDSGIITGESGQQPGELLAARPIPAEGVTLERPDFVLWLFDEADRNDESKWTRVVISEALTAETAALDGIQAALARQNVITSPEDYLDALNELVQTRIRTSVEAYKDATPVSLELVEIDGEQYLKLVTHEVNGSTPQVALSYTTLDRTKLTLTAAIDILDPSFENKSFGPFDPAIEATWNRLTLGELRTGKKIDKFKPILKGEAAARLHVATNSDDLAGFTPQSFGIANATLGLPQVEFDFIVDAAIDLTEVLGKKDGETAKKIYSIDALQFDNVTLDVRDLVENVIAPLAEATTGVFGPIFDIFGESAGDSSAFLNTRIPVISDLLGRTTFRSLLPGGTDGQLSRFLGQLFALPGEASRLRNLNFDDPNARDYVGAFNLGGWELVMDPTSPLYFPTAKTPVPIDLADAYASASDAGGFLKTYQQLATLKGAGGWELDLLSPSSIVNLLIGQPFDIISFGLPEIEDLSAGVSVNFDWDVIDFGGSASATLDALLRVGYDSTGLQRVVSALRAGSEPDWSALLDGFGIKTNTDGPEIEFNVGLDVSGEADVKLASGKGSIDASAKLEFDIVDPDQDGKLRIDEIAELTNNFNDLEHLFCMFDLSASASLSVSGEVKVAEVTIFSIDDFGFDTGDIDLDDLLSSAFTDCDVSLRPVFATPLRIDGKRTLRLNAGPFDYARLVGDIDDSEGVRFEVSGGPTELTVEAFNGAGLPLGSAQIYRAPADRPFERIIAFGSAQADTFNFGGVRDVFVEVDGQAGDDTLIAGRGGSLIKGGDGGDTIILGPGSDTVFSGRGGVNSNDVVRISTAENTGRDRIDFSDSDRGVTFVGYEAGTGSATVVGSAFDDEISVEGSVRVVAGRGNDRVTGDDGQQTLLGGDGNDTMSGGGDNDLLLGGFGNDDLDGGDGNDELKGEQGDDTLLGGAGNDTTIGGAGNDTVIAGAGDTLTTGGSGRDSLEFRIVDAETHFGELSGVSYHVLDENDNVESSTRYTQFETLSVTLGDPLADPPTRYNLSINGPRIPLTSITGQNGVDRVEIVNLPSDGQTETTIALGGGNDELTISDVRNALSIDYRAGNDSDTLVVDRSADAVGRAVTVGNNQLSGPGVGTVKWSGLETIEATWGTGADQTTVNPAGGSLAQVTIHGGAGDDTFIVESVIPGSIVTTSLNGNEGVDKATIVLPGNPAGLDFNPLGFAIETLEIDNRKSSTSVDWSHQANLETVNLGGSLFLNTSGADEVVFLGGTGSGDSLSVVDSRDAGLLATVDDSRVQTVEADGGKIVEFDANTPIEDLQVTRTVDGLGDVTSSIVSDDGKFVFAVSKSDETLAIFRNTTSGPRFVELFEDGVLGVSGMNSPSDIAVSGRFVYVSSLTDSEVAVFERLVGNDRHIFRGMISSSLGSGIRKLVRFNNGAVYALTLSDHFFDLADPNTDTFSDTFNAAVDVSTLAVLSNGRVVVGAEVTGAGNRLFLLKHNSEGKYQSIKETVFTGDITEIAVGRSRIVNAFPPIFPDFQIRVTDIYVGSRNSVSQIHLLEVPDSSSAEFTDPDLWVYRGRRPRAISELVYDPDQNRLIAGFDTTPEYTITIDSFYAEGLGEDVLTPPGISDDWQLYAAVATTISADVTDTYDLTNNAGETVNVGMTIPLDPTTAPVLAFHESDAPDGRDVLLTSTRIDLTPGTRTLEYTHRFREGGKAVLTYTVREISTSSASQEMEFFSFNKAAAENAPFHQTAFQFSGAPFDAATSLTVDTTSDQLFAAESFLTRFTIDETLDANSQADDADVNDVVTVTPGDQHDAFLNTQSAADEIETVISSDGRFAYSVSSRFGAITIHNRDAATGEIGSLFQTIDAALLPDAQLAAAELSDGTTLLYVSNPHADALQVYRERNNGTFALTQILANDHNGNGELTRAGDLVVRSTNGVGRQLYVATAGEKAIQVYDINATTGQLTHSATVSPAGFSAPKSITLSETENGVTTLYSASSSGKKLHVFDVDANGALTLRQTLDINKPSQVVVGTAELHQDRVFVAGSTDDSISVYQRDRSNGDLTLLTTIDGPTGVHRLASYTSPFNDSSYLLAANNAGQVVVYSVTADSLKVVQRLRNGSAAVTGISGPTDLTVVVSATNVATLHVSSGGTANLAGGIATFAMLNETGVAPTLYTTLYDNIESLTVETGDGDDEVIAGGVDVPFTLNTHDGNDDITLQNTPDNMQTTVDLGGDDDRLDLLSTGDNATTSVTGGSGNDRFNVFSTATGATTDLTGNDGEDTFQVKGTLLGSDVTIHGNDPTVLPGDTLIFDPQSLDVDHNTTDEFIKVENASFGVDYDTIEHVIDLSSPTANAGGPYDAHADTTPIREGDAITLDASSSEIPSGHTDVVYTWSIGPATAIATGSNPTISWADLFAAGIDDDGTYPVSVEVTTQATVDGEVIFLRDIASTTLTIANTAPTLTAPDGEGEAGSPYQMQLDATDVGNDAVQTWTVDWGDGTDADTYFGLPSIAEYTYASAGTYTINITATDEDGDYTTTATATIHPAARISGPTTVDEGATYSLELIKGFLPIDSWTIEWGDGESTTDVAGNVTTKTHAFADDGLYEISVLIKRGGQTERVDNTVRVSVGNVAPEITNVTFPAQIDQGNTSSTISVEADDVGTLDTLTYEFDFDNDGRFEVSSETTPVLLPFSEVGTQTFGVRVRDDDGGVSPIQRHDIEVRNIAPSVDGVSAEEAPEGSTARVVVDASDPGDDRLTYEFDFDNDGVYEISSAANSALHIFDDDGIYRVNVRVRDEHGAYSTPGSVDVTVHNVAPSYLPPEIDGLVYEGGTATITVVGTDPAGANDPLTYYFDLDNDGTFDVDNTTGVITHNYPEDGSYAIGIQIRDGDGGVANIFTEIVVDDDGNTSEVIRPFEVHVINVSPTVTLETDASIGNPSSEKTVSIHGVVTDPGILDTHIVEVEWGDGTTNTVDVDPNDGTWSATHTYQQGGVLEIGVRAIDDDGGVSDIVTTFVAIEGVGVVDGTLFIVGTNGRDHVKLKPDDKKDELKVDIKLNQGSRDKTYIKETYTASEIKKVVTYLFDGDDHYDGGPNGGSSHNKPEWTATQYVFGGDGDDHISGGRGADFLHGGDGRDHLSGGNGNDILIGGDGRDKLKGGRGNDLLIGGDTVNDFSTPSKLTELDDLFSDWLTGDIWDALFSFGGFVDDCDKDDLKGEKGYDILIGGYRDKLKCSETIMLLRKLRRKSSLRAKRRRNQPTRGVSGIESLEKRTLLTAVFGDFNADGYDDLAVGTPLENIGSDVDAGAVNVIYGSSSGLSTAGNQIWHQDSDGIRWSAEDGDLFGSALAAGDFNGDNIMDLAIGVPGESVGDIKEAGAVFILYGTDDGLAAADHQIWTQDSEGVGNIPERFDHFGSALAAGDFDGDGIQDLAIGVPGENVGSQNDAGAVHILYGTSDGLTGIGSQYVTQDGDGINDIVGQNERYDMFGAALAAGNLGQTAEDDLAIGAPGEDVGSQVDAGAVTVIYGRSGTGLLLSSSRMFHQNTEDGSDEVPGQAEDFDYFGSSLAIGNLGNGSVADLAVGVPGEDIGSIRDAGAVNVFYGTAADGLKVADSDIWSQNSDGIKGGSEAYDLFGTAVAIGDYNGDGTGDLAIGVPGESIEVEGDLIIDENGDTYTRLDLDKVSAGMVNVIYGGSGGLTTSDRVYHQNTEGIAGKVEENDAFGSWLAAGYANSGGRADLAIAVPGEDVDSKSNSGGVHVLYGRTSGGFSTSNDQFWSQAGSIEGGPENGDRFGGRMPVGLKLPGYEVPKLESNPGASHTIYLDFTGHANKILGIGFDTPSFKFDDRATEFSITELAIIQDVWDHMAEDYAPFDVNVTTIGPPSSGPWERVVFGGSWQDHPLLNNFVSQNAASGVAPIGNYWNPVLPNIAYVFTESILGWAGQNTDVAAQIGTTGSHEAGHAFGLEHKSDIDDNGNVVNEYSPGDGDMTPIMGGNLSTDRTIWTRAELTNPDDSSLTITGNDDFNDLLDVLGARSDDHGDSINSATDLGTLSSIGGLLVDTGIIEDRNDEDVFTFTVQVAGSVDVWLLENDIGANLDADIVFGNADTGEVLLVASPNDDLGVQFATNVEAGDYYIIVQSENNFRGDVGQYTLRVEMGPELPSVSVGLIDLIVFGIDRVDVTFGVSIDRALVVDTSGAYVTTISRETVKTEPTKTSRESTSTDSKSRESTDEKDAEYELKTITTIRTEEVKLSTKELDIVFERWDVI
eukprot:g8272.t1